VNEDILCFAFSQGLGETAALKHQAAHVPGTHTTRQGCL
jgi:hypothetical protein